MISLNGYLNSKRKMIDQDEIYLAKHYLSILKAQASLHEFAKQSWAQIEGPTTPFVDGWHIEAICEHLEACYRREIKSIIINIPPRCCKSSLIAVMFPAWVWLQNPAEKFLFASYAQPLSTRDSVKCRRLISSPWYQERWGHLYSLTGDQNTKIRFENDHNGYRISTSTGGSSTGEGGSILVWDDANNAKHGESKVKREGTNDWFSQVWSTRLNDLSTGVNIGVAQRIHENDLSGFLMSQDDTGRIVRLILPMEYESKRKSKTVILPSSNGKPWEDPRSKDGELLWPNKIGSKELIDLKKGLGTSYRIAGQLQQRPSPDSGGLIKKGWFKLWKQDYTPALTLVLQSWDTALEAGEMDAYSACTTWGLFKEKPNGPNNMILLGLWRGRVEYPDLRRMAIRLWKDYRDDGRTPVIPDGTHVPNVVLVEAKASGHSIASDLARAGITVSRFNPTKHGDKIERVKRSTYLIEAGRVWVPARPPEFMTPRDFGRELIDLCAIFPNSDARDVVDTMTQAILRLRSDGYLEHVSDYKDDLGSTSSAPNHPFYGPDRER